MNYFELWSKVWVNNITQEAEDTARQRQNFFKQVYKARRLCNGGPKKVAMVKGKDGRLLTKKDEVKDRWREHFAEVLNRPVPEITAEVEETNEVNDRINTGAISKDEIRSALGDMKSGEAPGIDNLTTDLLRADTDTTVNVLGYSFNTTWEEERVPEDWCRGLIVKLPKKGGLTTCRNWTGITLMSTIAKVMGRILMMRIAAGTDAELRKEQAGFKIQLYKIDLSTRLQGINYSVCEVYYPEPWFEIFCLQLNFKILNLAYQKAFFPLTF